MTLEDIKLAMMYGVDPSLTEKAINSEAVERAYSPFDAVAGGVAGTMTAPVASIARFLGETAIDPVMEAALNYAADSGLGGYAALPTKNGMRRVFHRTTADRAKNILDTGKFTPREDGIFFSTVKDGQAKGYGDGIVELDIPESKLQLDDEFPDGEQHYRMPAKANEQISLDDFIVRMENNGDSLSLPMDEASRMQRASDQGYTKGLYRGGKEAADGAFYTPDKQAAEAFASRFDGGDVREYAIAKGNSFSMDRRYKPEELGGMKKALEDSGAKNLADYLDEIIVDDFSGAIPARNLWQMLTMQTGGDTNAFRVLQKSGFDTLDAGQEVVTLKPQKEIVRDMAKAVFDPKRKGESDIFASILPFLTAGGAGYAVMNDDSL